MIVLFAYSSHPFSQWFARSFQVENITYANMEQYMMASKAKLFGDDDAYQRIMAAASPRECKALGRQVRNFDNNVWERHREEIVYRGNLAKFGQHSDLRDVLLATGNATIAEAAPWDTIWGIGLADNDPRAQNPSQWLGLNLLGQALMRVRDSLKNH